MQFSEEAKPECHEFNSIEANEKRISSFQFLCQNESNAIINKSNQLSVCLFVGFHLSKYLKNKYRNRLFKAHLTEKEKTN